MAVLFGFSSAVESPMGLKTMSRDASQHTLGGSHMNPLNVKLLAGGSEGKHKDPQNGLAPFGIPSNPTFLHPLVRRVKCPGQGSSVPGSRASRRQDRQGKNPTIHGRWEKRW